METNSAEEFDAKQSLQVIHEMIETSKKKIQNDGILFILWGWMMFYSYMSTFFIKKVLLSHAMENFLKTSRNVLAVLVILYTIYYIWKKGRKVTTYIGVSLRYVWIGLIVSLSLINMIIFHQLQEFNPELQHPVFMVLIAFATLITGGILRYNLIVAGGILFAALAFACAYLPLDYQMLAEALAWLVAFVVPGHILFANRNS